jgi:pyrroloquinoline quinone biosynthesis protein E
MVAELTYRCPLHCPYCSNPLEPGAARQRDELSGDEWARVLAEARALGVVQVALTGGEPLLRRDLETIVAAAREHGLYSTLVTAGLGLSRDRAVGLRAAGLDHVQVSVQDADPGASDEIAGARSFARKLEAARLAKELGFPLTLNFVLHRRNLDRIEEILELCEGVGADRVELANTQWYGWAVPNQAALMPARTQLERAERAVAAARERTGPRMAILYVLPDWFEEYPKPCMGGWGRTALVVAPHGAVLPCQAAAMIPDLDPPSVREHALEWVWFESAAFNRFRGTDWMREPCRSCPLDRQEVDFGGCRCQALRLTGDAAATDPVCHISPHHPIVVGERERAGPDAPLVYRSMRLR